MVRFQLNTFLPRTFSTHVRRPNTDMAHPRLRTIFNDSKAADGTLNLGGSTAFSADHVPSGNEQVPVYRGAGQTLPLTLKYVAQ